MEIMTGRISTYIIHFFFRGGGSVEILSASILYFYDFKIFPHLEPKLDIRTKIKILVKILFFHFFVCDIQKDLS